MRLRLAQHRLPGLVPTPHPAGGVQTRSLGSEALKREAGNTRKERVSFFFCPVGITVEDTSV